MGPHQDAQSGADFLHEIREAITASDRLVLVVGPKAVTSDYVRAEWLYALEIGKVINPVLRLGDYDLMPDELKLLDAPDCRDDAHYQARLETLVRQVSEPVAAMGRLIAVPSLPPHFLHRPERLRALKDAVLADLHRPVVITSTAARVGVHGMGGIGKSVLATLLGRDFEVRRCVPRRRGVGLGGPESDACDPPAQGGEALATRAGLRVSSRGRPCWGSSWRTRRSCCCSMTSGTRPTPSPSTCSAPAAGQL